MKRLLLASLMTGALGLSFGCAGRIAPINESAWNDRWIDRTRAEPSSVFESQHVRQLPLCSGQSGRALDWQDVLAAADWADVIFIGEQHDDAVGHSFQRAVTEDVLAKHRRGALSMEMLERDDQPVTDDYLDDLIDAQTFEKLTNSTDWGDKGKWPEWYQPIVDAAKANRADVIAANAPRRYVRLARTQGYDVLRRLPNDRRALVSFPRRMSDDGYWNRFVGVMTQGHGEGENPEPLSKQRLQELKDGFRSQTLWDATMADSIFRAQQAGARKIIHLVGQFHSDFNGGTVQQLRARWPQARILTISMQREDGPELREQDRDRADIIVYTGARPPEPETQPDEVSEQVESSSDEQDGEAADQPRDAESSAETPVSTDS